jgi:nitrate/TMAO reductase-like tetraheme cytochrome c subunit
MRAWQTRLLLGFGGLVLGAAAIIGVTEFNFRTSTDAFCTSCHTMSTVAAEPSFQESSHRHNNFGVIATCSDCHIPRTSWYTETYTHISKGIRDVIAEQIGGFQDPVAWVRRRAELASYATSEMRANGSATCHSCHLASAIEPRSNAGKAAHATFTHGETTCVDCHVVHSAR